MADEVELRLAALGEEHPVWGADPDFAAVDPEDLYAVLVSLALAVVGYVVGVRAT
ncbi:MAG: hypothetical protein ACRDNP_02700 [Gaiellaceae bacterium]